MTTDLDAYRQHLVAALRRYDVPAPRIGEAVAEVESHLADTGEDPVDAFGEPDDYARALSRDARPRTNGTNDVRPRTRWTNFVVAVVSFAGAGTATTALLDGRWVAAAVAASVLVALGGWLYLTRGRDRIVDPRTGLTLNLPMPRWAFVTVAVALVALAAVGLVLRGT